MAIIMILVLKYIYTVSYPWIESQPIVGVKLFQRDSENFRNVFWKYEIPVS